MVRKNHLTGKNHIKLVADYYEDEAKKLGIWRSNDLPFEITVDKLYRGVPGSQSKQPVDYYRLSQTKKLPPPPTLGNLPGPPPRVLHDVCGKEVIPDMLKTVN
ncbi:hypothetical protein BN7_4465 [Wickerhamomyces ciferrii]|uniref:Uncharacterized protein n=1 Tax=Wickerhamomyces ciferrii (strain ATCC 14091 / BCRC 22168 / CBS 111 / JCM 3599 / NBRC 0793 / NRRL Y-1031 F-60-10) TaxID=1206466 RepID=K0KPI6_WICCF|nr:uncharacterized protein BN7_4465 [Wickerhamomyces ciferrii]CCH44896.1 hypothetical protein BN7_4465 [Wickerhamomyces ciferrii]